MLLKIDDPLVEKMLKAVEGEPECSVLYASERFSAFAQIYCSARSEEPFRIVVLSPDDERADRGGTANSQPLSVVLQSPKGVLSVGSVLG